MSENVRIFFNCRNLSEILSEICPKFWKFGPKILCPKIKCPKFIGPKFLEVKVLYFRGGDLTLFRPIAPPGGLVYTCDLSRDFSRRFLLFSESRRKIAWNRLRPIRNDKSRAIFLLVLSGCSVVYTCDICRDNLSRSRD